MARDRPHHTPATTPPTHHRRTPHTTNHTRHTNTDTRRARTAPQTHIPTANHNQRRRRHAHKQHGQEQRKNPPTTTTTPPRRDGKPTTASHTAKSGAGRKGPTGDAGEGPNLRGLGPPRVTVSAPPEHTQYGGICRGPLVSSPRWHRPGGVTNGPDKEHSPRHVLRFGPSEGLRVGHTVHRGRQETRLSRKDSPATHSVPDPGVGNG